MLRTLLALLLIATPTAADVGPFPHATGASLYVLFNDGSDTAVAMTEGTALKAGTYTAADAAIDAAGLADGTASSPIEYAARIMIGSAASPSASDPVVGSAVLYWGAGVEVDPTAAAIAAYDPPTRAELTNDKNEITTAIPSAATIRAEMDNNSTLLGLIAVDTDQLQAEWDDGGRLDLLLDGALSNATTAATQATTAATNTAAAAIRTALGLAAADVDSQLDAIATDAGTAASNSSVSAVPFLNRKPNKTIKISSRADSYLTQGRVRVMAGENYLVALEYPDQDDWLYSMELPVSPDTDQLTVDSNAYGVNRNLAMVEVTIAAGLAEGTEITLPVTVNPTQGTTDIRKVLFEVIDPTQ